MMLHITVPRLWNSESCRAKAIQRTEFFEDEKCWSLKGCLKAEVAGAWQVKVRRILLYYGVEHDQEKRIEEGMQVILINKRKIS